MRQNEAKWIEARGRWQINVQQDGARRTFTSSTPGRRGKAEAERKAEAWLDDTTTAETARAEKLLDLYKEHLKRTKSTSHAGQYGGFIRLYIAPIIGHKKIARLTVGDLQDVLDLAFANRGLSDKTLRDVRGCLMNWLKWARAHGYTRLHPEGLTIPQGAKKPEKKILQPADVATLFRASDTVLRGKRVEDWYIHAYRFAVITGLRPGELTGLSPADVTGQKCTVRRSVNIHGEITQGKNQNARRTFRLPEQAAREVEAQRAMLKAEGLISPYLFPAPDGGAMVNKNFLRAWRRYCETHGMTETTLYELRHTYVSINKEMPSGLKKMVIGHSESMDTEGTYSHALAGDLARAAQYTERAFSAILEEQKNA